MIIKQLSVFLENKEGRLFAAADVLAKNNINIRALSLADTSEFGILRLIVDKPEEGKAVLAETGVVVRVTNVLGILMDDVPGGTLGALHLMADAGINVEYMYGLSIDKAEAYVVLKSSSASKTEEVLKANGVETLSPEELLKM